MLAKDMLENNMPKTVPDKDLALELIDTLPTDKGLTMASIGANTTLYIHALKENKEKKMHSVSKMNKNKQIRQTGQCAIQGSCLVCKKQSKYYCSGCPCGINGQKQGWFCAGMSVNSCFHAYHANNKISNTD